MEAAPMLDVCTYGRSYERKTVRTRPCHRAWQETGGFRCYVARANCECSAGISRIIIFLPRTVIHFFD